MLGPYTPAFTASLGLGGILGIIAGYLRAQGTKFEGQPIATLLGVMAGMVAGGMAYIIVVAFASLLALASGSTNVLLTFCVATCLQVLLFSFYVKRRR